MRLVTTDHIALSQRQEFGGQRIGDDWIIPRHTN
jgi:hypothetical protein